MSKLVFAAVAAALALTSFAVLPASAVSTRVTVTDQPGGPGGEGGNGGGHGDSGRCGEELGFLPRVYPAEVAGIDNHFRVWITPICDGSEFSLLSSEGNAAYLRPTIAKNKVLVSTLLENDFQPTDVFAVKMMGDDTINLYVRHFR